MSPRPRAERRQNRPLREVLDELIGHAREIARRAKDMTPAELDYAQQRLEWLADEGGRLATGEAPPGGGLQRLLEPKMGIRVVVEGAHLPGSRALGKGLVPAPG